MVLREILRRVELRTTTAADEHQKLKHVIYLPHRGAQIVLRAIRDVPSGAVPRSDFSKPVVAN